ncbi:ABC transporter [Mesorhizobium sp. Root102]|uniref:amino acid ABC transporter permease n=1 Tax=Mesorhizobium sp. Root102 TaxID=1736422 RepID=UPI0007006F2A|nr:amino acid ABC transporter permease [Mesorhizobium sp. Root102]KQU83925.1 ABC transporter [Mesorhizobium sp. Root102]
MNYTLQFGQVIDRLPYLAGGAWLSLLLATLAFFGGMIIGVFGAMAKLFGGRILAGIANIYVVFFTNTPALVQVYFLYFALPSFGIILPPFEAVLIGLTLNSGAYLTEIQRAGFLSIHRNEVEAAETIGLSQMQSVWYVIVPHIVRTLYPSLSNQYILITLGTSMAAIFGVEELTGRALSLNAETFRSIEIFVITAGLYIAITLVANVLLVFLGRYYFRARMRLF